jgi:hypothetical protein
LQAFFLQDIGMLAHRPRTALIVVSPKERKNCNWIFLYLTKAPISKKRLFCNIGSSILIVKPIGYMYGWHYLSKPYHVYEGLIQQDMFATKTTRLEVEK